MRTSIDRESVEYLHVPITAPEGSDLTAVQLALMASGRPATADWADATWNQDSQEAVLLVGPLNTPGTRSVWVRVTDNPEVPVFQAGSIGVT